MNPPPAASGKHQRSFKNYLLDPAFQLKYTGYLVGIALVLSAALGGLLWQTSGAVIELSRDSVAQGRESVKQGTETVKQGKALVKESQKLSAVVRMQIEKSYADEPDLKKVYDDESEKRQKELEVEQKRLEVEQKRLEEQTQALSKRAADIEGREASIRMTLLVGLSTLVVFIALAGIVITHRVAGPIFKMRKQLEALTSGKLTMPSKLRKGDELVDFFEAFSNMVKSLRDRQEAEIKLLEEAIAKVDDDKDAAKKALSGLRDEMKAELG